MRSMCGVQGDSPVSNPWANKLKKIVETNPAAEIKVAVRHAIAGNAMQDSVIDAKQTPETIPAQEPSPEAQAYEHATKQAQRHANPGITLSRLIDADFPFDESQIAAVEGMVQSTHACLTGAAGTGKTTVTKKLVDELIQRMPLNLVNMNEYWKKGYDSDDREDEYEAPVTYIPSIAMCAFTGRASQMIKRNFPRDWHGNIMTIHRLLGFVPEYYGELDVESGEVKNKMRFVPTYGPDCLLPWDIIIIDEAGMLGLDLWHQLLAACRPTTRIYMVGDINQLPPVHGRSVFGFAMARWPSYELTHIHRQQGSNNLIVDNAWRVLKGQLPQSGGNFQMMELRGDAQMSSRFIRGLMPAMIKKGIYEPNRDTIITPINGEEGARGYALGQLPLNREFAMIFNPRSEHPRYIIDGGREKKHFAVGDKVMATKNDHEAGITNGMTGIITSIERNPGYAGDQWRFGIIEEVNEYMANEGFVDEGEELTLEELEADFESKSEAQAKKEAKEGRGPSSHIVTVRFGDEDSGFEMPFASLSEVGSLMTAYVVTCHKMQGGESPVIIIICHDAHKQMMYREWLYTAITRASRKCILLYTPTALRTAINKQSIKGTTLAEKVAAFNALQTNNGLGVAVKVRLPEPEGIEYGQHIGESLPVVDHDVPSDVAGDSDDSDLPWNDGPRDLVVAEAREVAVESEDVQAVAPVQEAVPPLNSESDARAEREARARAQEAIDAAIRARLLYEAWLSACFSRPTTRPADIWDQGFRVVDPKPESVEPQEQAFYLGLAFDAAPKRLTHTPLLRLTYQPQPPVSEAAVPEKPKNPWAAKLAMAKKG